MALVDADEVVVWVKDREFPSTPPWVMQRSVGVDHTKLTAVGVQLLYPGDLQPAGRGARQVPLGAGPSAVRHPEMHLDLVSLQDAESFALMPQLGEAEGVLEEAHGTALIRNRERGHCGQELR